ncbi:MAG: hypothetical protein ACRDOL_22605 [Streptosporangiaceae bacterium]
MSHVALAAEITGYTAWLLGAWALANRAVTLLARLEDERRRRRNARRFRTWQPPRHTPGPGSAARERQGSQRRS